MDNKLSELKELEIKRQGVFGMMAGSTNAQTGKMVTAEAETLRLIELVNDYGGVLERLEAAEARVKELENDEVRQRLANAEYQLEMKDLAIRNVKASRRAQWHKRKSAEAELARRDAAAGQAVAWQFLSDSGKWMDIGNPDEASRYGYKTRQLYTAAQPAVLPPEIDGSRVAHQYLNHMAEDKLSAYVIGHNEALRKAAALGCQPQKVVEPDYFARLVASAVQAAKKAMVKFPQPNYVLLKVAEEAGEVVQAGVHYAEGRETWDNLESEVVQTIAMLYRLVVEGDQINGITPPAGIPWKEAE